MAGPLKEQQGKLVPIFCGLYGGIQIDPRDDETEIEREVWLAIYEDVGVTLDHEMRYQPVIQ
jgi:hypothetical protein